MDIIKYNYNTMEVKENKHTEQQKINKTQKE